MSASSSSLSTLKAEQEWWEGEWEGELDAGRAGRAGTGSSSVVAGNPRALPLRLDREDTLEDGSFCDGGQSQSSILDAYQVVRVDGKG